MTEWKYPGDDAIRMAFAANVLKIIEEKGLTLEEFEHRMQEVRQDLDVRIHARGLGRAVKKRREERNMTSKFLAASAGLSVRVLIQVERGRGGLLLSVPEVCRIAVALKLRPHELMAHYEDAVKHATEPRSE